MPPKNKSQPEYLVVTNFKNKGVMGTRLLSRGEPYLPVDATLGNKRLPMPQIGDIVLADMSDADKMVGTADILEIITDAKEIKRLRKDGSIPSEEEYAEMLAIKGNYEDKGAKTKGKKAVAGGEDDEDGIPTVEGTSNADGAPAAAASKKKATPKASPSVSAKTTSPGLNPSKVSLEEQMSRLDVREGNADLDDI